LYSRYLHAQDLCCHGREASFTVSPKLYATVARVMESMSYQVQKIGRQFSDILDKILAAAYDGHSSVFPMLISSGRDPPLLFMATMTLIGPAYPRRPGTTSPVL